MRQPIGKDSMGRPYLRRAVAAKLENGTIIPTGNTKDMNNRVYRNFLQMLHNLVP